MYCTRADLYPAQISGTDVLQLTDDTGDRVALDATCEAIVDQAIEDAEAVIDGYCQKVYTVPLSPVSNLVRKYCVDIAIYNLYSRRANNEAPAMRINRYSEAIAYFKLVTKGEASLGALTPAETSSPHEVDIESNTPIFTRDDLENF